ncbi:MAG TPA: hypothetical protein VMF66_02240 [Candidatus Acidoferrum sp.]|nr:hypothetical protein [Candidatus Acidoferrum sp.]
MLRNQYLVMAASLVTGFVWIGMYHLVVSSWFLSRLSILLAIVSFVPAGLVALVHLREAGPFLWWERSNVVLTTRRSPSVEKVELIVMAALWTVIFGFVIVVIFFLSR